MPYPINSSCSHEVMKMPYANSTPTSHNVCPNKTVDNPSLPYPTTPMPVTNLPPPIYSEVVKKAIEENQPFLTKQNL